jgi:HK97 family phage major capsid protein
MKSKNWIFFVIVTLLSGAMMFLDHYLSSLAGGALFLATGAAASTEEFTEWFKNEIKKIDLTNPDTLNGIKTAIAGDFTNSVNGLGDKLQTLIDEVKHSQEKPAQPGENMAWYNKLLSTDHLNSAMPEELKNKLAFNKYSRLQFKQLRNALSVDETKILIETRDNIAQQHAVQNETTTTEGGYLVPVPTGNLLLDAIRENGIWMNDCTIVPVQSNTVKIPVLTAAGHTAITAASLFKKETSTGTPRRYAVGGYTFGIAQPILKDYGFIIPVTKELEEDGIADIMAIVRQYVGEYFGILGDDILFRGNGQSSTDQTLGIYEYTGLTEHEINGTSFTNLVYDDIINGDAKHRTVDRANLKRYMSPTAWAHIKTLKDAQDRYYLDGNERLNNVLEGKPVVETDSAYAMSESAANTPMIITGNFKRILVAVKAGIGMQAVNVSQSDVASFYDGTNTRHMWQENMVGIRVNLRFDIVCPLQNRLVAHVTKAS